VRLVVANLDFGIGGGSSHTVKLGRAFRRLGHTAYAVVLTPFGELYGEYQDAFDGLAVVVRRNEGRNGYLQRVAEAIQRFSPDGVINNEVPFVQAAFAVLWEKVVTATVLHGIRESEVDVCCGNPDFTDLAVGVSENTAACLRVRLPDSKVFEIPVGVERYTSTRLDKSSGVFRLVYLGRIVRPAKNLRLLEEVIAELDRRSVQFRLTLIGDGEYRAEMQARLSWAQERGIVKFLGALTPEQVASVLPGFHALVLTSEYEGTPHAVIEAMAAGVVPVCSQIAGSTDRIVEHERNGYLCRSGKAADFCRAIEHLIADESTRQRMSERAKEAAINRFCMDTIAGRYLECMEPLTHSKRRTAKNLIVKAVVPGSLYKYCPGRLAMVKARLGRLFKGDRRGDARRSIELLREHRAT